MRRGEVWRKTGTHYLIVSGEFYHTSFPNRVIVVRVLLGDPHQDHHPYAVPIDTPLAGYVLPDLIEWVRSDTLSAAFCLGVLTAEATAEVDRHLRGVLELP